MMFMWRMILRCPHQPTCEKIFGILKFEILIFGDTPPFSPPEKTHGGIFGRSKVESLEAFKINPWVGAPRQVKRYNITKWGIFNGGTD